MPARTMFEGGRMAGTRGMSGLEGIGGSVLPLMYATMDGEEVEHGK